MRDGAIAVAVQEERLTRRKRDSIELDRRSEAVDYCLSTVGISPADLRMVVVCGQDRTAGDERRTLLDEQLAVTRLRTSVHHIGHHRGHLESALALSGLASCAGLVVDGMGSPISSLDDEERAVVRGDVASDWESISLYEVRDGQVRALEKQTAAAGKWLGDADGGMRRFGSLGGMYASSAEQVFGDLGKSGHLMGLAPFGRAALAPNRFIRVEDGVIRYLDDVPRLFRGDARWPSCSAAYEDLAASVQATLEQAILSLARRARELTGLSRLCYAGGVALNANANERLHRQSGFDEIFIPAAAEDSGPAIGAAHWGSRRLNPTVRAAAATSDGFGRTYSSNDIEAAIASVPGALAHDLGDGMPEACARRIAHGAVVGWFQGGSELGPRALGQRSILADPREAATKDRLNARVKRRETFRPFAPAILQEHVAEWFGGASEGDASPYMLRIWSVRPEMRVLAPAIVHIDGSSRPQTVTPENGRFHELIGAFHRLTGLPMLVNTSFNVAGEPIVETPADALWCFLTTDIDLCVIGDRMVEKPRYGSALGQLRPTLPSAVAEALTAGGALDPVEYATLTPWGEQIRSVAGGVRPILRQVDGVRKLADIASACRALGIHSPDDNDLVDLFVWLRRRGAVGFAGMGG